MIFPSLLPDMTIYSLVACIDRQTGNCLGRSASENLFDSRTAGLRHDFPSRLDEFCRRTEGCYGDPIDVCRKATFLPYFLRFRPPSVEDLALQILCGDETERLKLVLGLHAGPTDARFPLKACRQCISEDESTHGVAYWHLSHQLPGVYLCQTHAAPLIECGLRVDRRGLSAFLLPGDKTFQANSMTPSLLRQEPLLSRLSSLSRDVLASSLPVQYDQNVVRACYVHGLRDHGLLTRGGKVRWREFLKMMKDTYGGLSLAPYDRILGERHLAGLLRLVRTPRSDFHTVYHTLMIDALFGDWANFCSVYAWQSAIECAPTEIDSPTIGEAATPLSEDMLAIAHRVTTEHRSLSSICKEMGIDYQTAMRQLAVLGFGNSKRPKVLTADRRQNVIASLQAGLAQRDIAKLHGLSRSTVDRVCQETPRLHSEWAKANHDRKRQLERKKFSSYLDAHPTMNRKDARDRHPPGYCWLKRHDPEWLNGLLEATPRNQGLKPRSRAKLDWGRRDLECLRALETLSKTLTFERGERKQPGTILRKLPRLSFNPRLELLPKSSRFIEELLSPPDR